MDDLILRYLSGETTDVERHRVEKWRATSAQNEARFREAQALWEGLGHVASRRQHALPDVDSMMAEAERRRLRARAKGSRRAVLRSPWVGYGIAAAAGLAMVFFGFHVWEVRETPGAVLSAVTSSVGAGHVVSMTLSDGSYVRAAEGTRLEFPPRAGWREVVMEGRAFFAVSRGSEPFVVRTPEGDVTVHGTRFEVQTNGGGLLRVVVVEGVVELDAPEGSVRARTGQVATVQAGGEPRVTTVGDVWSLLNWPGGLMAFQQTPLEEVAAQLKHHFGVDVVIEDSAAASRGVTGSFREDSLNEVVDAVCAVTGIRCGQRGDTIVLGMHGR